jgi:hypothetical protein
MPSPARLMSYPVPHSSFRAKMNGQFQDKCKYIKNPQVLYPNKRRAHVALKHRIGA